MLRGKPSRSGGLTTGNVTPDIIAHRGGACGPNLVAIEVTIGDVTAEARRADVEKLQGYKRYQHHEHALHVQLHRERWRCLVEPIALDAEETVGQHV